MRWSHVLAFVIGVTTTAGLYEANRMMQKDNNSSPAKVTKQAPPAPSAVSKRAAALRAEAEKGKAPPGAMRRKMPGAKSALLREKSLNPIARTKRAEMASKFRSLNAEERAEFRQQAMDMLEEPEPPEEEIYEDELPEDQD
ncbi:MAG: hypothetical protein HN348_13175 [Proteobacteria bacterium]|nr:hypothetical protein [Pseudomonadota bacterium]